MGTLSAPISTRARDGAFPICRSSASTRATSCLTVEGGAASAALALRARPINTAKRLAASPTSSR